MIILSSVRIIKKYSNSFTTIIISTIYYNENDNDDFDCNTHCESMKGDGDRQKAEKSTININSIMKNQQSYYSKVSRELLL